MGIDRSGWRLLGMLARTGHVDFSSTVMIGRQRIHVRQENLPVGARIDAQLCYDDFAEPLFQGLGAKRIESLDANNFEGATILHDLNEPLIHHHGQFSLVYDGGTIEHVLNMPQVIANYNALLTDRGSLVIHTQCNGAPSHGFYQLSPEFFFSVLCPTNGFAETTVLLVDHDRDDEWLRLDPPGGRRHSLPNRRLDILVVSRKTGSVSRVRSQQSDYLSAWEKSAAPKHRRRAIPFKYLLGRKSTRRLWRQGDIFCPESHSL